MTRKDPSNDAPQRDKVKDPRLQQTYPADNPRSEPDETDKKRSQKQPGQDLRDPQKGDDDGE